MLHSLKTVFTKNKVINVVSNLKGAIPFALKSRLMFKRRCPKCHKTYIGQTTRQISIRAKKHAAKSTPLQAHFSKCDSAVSIEDFESLDGARSKKLLLTLEDLYIWQQKPLLNTKNEFRRRSLICVF